MKKLLLTVLAIAGFSFMAQAQEFGYKKADFIVEGFFQSSNKNDKTADSKKSNLLFNPKFGYFVTDKIAVGAGLGFSNKKEVIQLSLGKAEAKINVFSAAVFGRYYFLEIGTRFKTYAELTGSYGSISTERIFNSNTTKEPKANRFTVDAGIGANYFLTQHIAAGFVFSNVASFATVKQDTEGAKAYTEFNTNINVFDNFFNTAQFGLTYKF
ncbi:outer membrane beta-barrel protein [Sphingobacterium spiritivorum]|uniref:outer membrane beta-barrel protein n=1 Tax=Sphingobacterium spiritivorum TaxID=258 RepID=UPI00191B1F7B|nr:outer membrane beta-barrel protein [Sphingobacterium spiritivorum]QQT26600.1 outer membrane beta-barrel protein [Sphingobacterium spiritivorum]